MNVLNVNSRNLVPAALHRSCMSNNLGRPCATLGILRGNVFFNILTPSALRVPSLRISERLPVPPAAVAADAGDYVEIQ
jgi:hypothetical protein